MPKTKVIAKQISSNSCEKARDKEQKRKKERAALQAQIEAKNAHQKIINEAELSALFEQVETCYRSNQNDFEKNVQFEGFLLELETLSKKSSFDSSLVRAIQQQIKLTNFYQTTIFQKNIPIEHWNNATIESFKSIKFLKTNFEGILLHERLGDFPFCYPLFIESAIRSQDREFFLHEPRFFTIQDIFFQTHTKNLNGIIDLINAHCAQINEKLTTIPPKGIIANLVSLIIGLFTDATLPVEKNAHVFLQAFSEALKKTIEEYSNLLLYTLYCLYNHEEIVNKIVEHEIDTKKMEDVIELVSYFNEQETTVADGKLTSQYLTRQQTVKVQIQLLEHLRTTINSVNIVEATSEQLRLTAPKSITKIDIWRKVISQNDRKIESTLTLVKQSFIPFLCTPQRDYLLADETLLKPGDKALVTHLKNLNTAAAYIRDQLQVTKNPNQLKQFSLLLKEIYNEYKTLLKKAKNNHLDSTVDLSLKFFRQQEGILRLGGLLFKKSGYTVENLPDAWWQKRLISLDSNSKEKKAMTLVENALTESVEKQISDRKKPRPQKKNNSGTKQEPLSATPLTYYPYTYTVPNILDQKKNQGKSKEKNTNSRIIPKSENKNSCSSFTHSGSDSSDLGSVETESVNSSSDEELAFDKLKLKKSNNNIPTDSLATPENQYTPQLKEQIKSILLVEYESRFGNSSLEEIQEKFKKAIQSLRALFWDKNNCCKAEVNYLFFAMRQEIHMIEPLVNKEKIISFFKYNKSKIHLYKVIEEIASDIYKEAQSSSDPLHKLSLLYQTRFMRDKAFLCSIYFRADPNLDNWRCALNKKNYALDNQIYELNLEIENNNTTPQYSM